ncbi:MAG TPA: response regulator [Blastocatellia bacterium]|nr:response regulator [Blastocatellia bacterium]
MKEKGTATERNTLLIIDDDVEWTDLLTVFFSQKYRVHVANSAQDAIDAFGDVLPSVIILDLVMPSIDGFGLMQRLNAMTTSRIPTVLTTGWDNADVQACAASVGCAAVLAKPVSLPELDRVVRSLVDGSPVQEAVGETPLFDHEPL